MISPSDNIEILIRNISHNKYSIVQGELFEKGKNIGYDGYRFSSMNKKNNQQTYLQALQELINNAERSLHHAKNLMNQIAGKKPLPDLEDNTDTTSLHVYKHGKSQVIEGVFNGRDMIGVDKKTYPVPANYASKSKIVEGSKLKVTIKSDGTFQYKILTEIPFDTTTGTLIKDGDHFVVITQGGLYQVIPASVTYLQARIGDRVSIRIPQGIKATYATIDALVPADLGLVEA